MSCSGIANCDTDTTRDVLTWLQKDVLENTAIQAHYYARGDRGSTHQFLNKAQTKFDEPG